MEFKRPESVLVVVYDGDGRVLLLQRVDNPRFWQSVTGSLEAGETPAEAARREVAEEIGWSGPAQPRDCHWRSEYGILPGWRHRYAPEVRRNLEHAFVLPVPSGFRPRLAPAEHLAYRWVDAREALGWCPSFSNRIAIARFVPVPGR